MGLLSRMGSIIMIIMFGGEKLISHELQELALKEMLNMWYGGCLIALKLFRKLDRHPKQNSSTLINFVHFAYYVAETIYP